MSVRLYVVTDTQSDGDYLVAAKNRNDAMNYVAKSVLMKLSAKPATPVDVLQSKKYGEDVIGEAADLAEWQKNENQTKTNLTANGETK